MAKKETELEKLERYFSELEVILNPNFLAAFKRQLMACYEENKKEAYAAANISQEALYIDQRINELRETMKRFEGVQGIGSFHIKCFYKELFKKFLNV